ncbi:HEAT repeat-containing protein 5B-like [Branchiostoma floridae]|uniref:HEAT repeat-containing protein 5A n=1 Tax=Branchiostoma floridae TaxID=7739 RepID=A0A9J7M2G1_BRAFL|nr:HEAT repeat-containing protein 5B-like [Branchiostoma floridae]
MELAHSLLLNEEALGQINEAKRPIFIYEWLRFLDKVLAAAHKADVKEHQKKLVEQLNAQMHCSPGPPTRKLLGKCLANLYSVGDTYSLFETVNNCVDILKNKDDSPSYLPTRLAAVEILGAIHEKMGRMVGSSFIDTVQTLLKAMKNAESQGRCEIMLALEKILMGLGSAAASQHKDIYKVARGCLVDRSLVVRVAAAKCLTQLVNEAPFMYTSELDRVASLCFQAMDGSNYDVRCAVARLLGVTMAAPFTPKATTGKMKKPSLDDVFSVLSSGFLRGGSGFLKGGGGELLKGGEVRREVRVGVTQAHVVFVMTLGGPWLERNMSVFLTHILDLLASPKATPTHVDAVYSRKCVSFMLRAVLGKLLGEKAQIAAARELCQFVSKQMAVVDDASSKAESDGRGAADISNTQHSLVCALQELGSLLQSLQTCAAPLVTEANSSIIEPVISVLLHPSIAARLAAAWCLRCIAVALPSQMTPLIDRCADRMNTLKSSPEAVSGYSYALAALIGGVHQCPLGIPHSKGKLVFSIAEELLRTATQNSRMSMQRTQAGWLLLGALMTLGPPSVKPHVPRMLLLWRNAFPRSKQELEGEKARGDAFTWQVTLEGRAGALCAMRSFVAHCSELLTDDVTRRLMTPLECAMTMMAHIPSVIKSYGAHLKASAAMVRLRLYDILALLPPTAYEGSFNALLRELVAEFTLTDNPANTTTSLLRSMCHTDDTRILGSWLEETDHKSVEDQLQPNSASGSGALEHDPSSIYLRVDQTVAVPGPLPLGVAVIDASVALFGVVFPHVAQKHRLQMLEHFAECIRQAKSQRQQAVQMNIFTAVLSALKKEMRKDANLKGLADNKGGLGGKEIIRQANELIMNALMNPNPILRCAAGEALGRMAQVVGDSAFIAQQAQNSFDKLKSARDAVSRTGHSLALGCLHRYVGGMGSGQHLNTSVSILLALAQDSSSPVVQAWALHALALISDSGGPMFRSYVEPSLSLVLQLSLTIPPAHTEVHQCLGKCLEALITTLGPELQGNSGAVATARTSCLVACAIMQDHPDSLVQTEAISCLQQLHLFAPRHVNLSSLVPNLCRNLGSTHLLLRRAAVACLRQLAQREAREVCEYAMTLVKDKDVKLKTGKDENAPEEVNITETGLEGVLFGMLDKEVDQKLRRDIHDTLLSMLQSLAADNLSHWLQLSRDVLTAATDTGGPPQPKTLLGRKDDKEDKEEDDDTAKFHAGGEAKTHPTVAPRWPTRMFATDCVRKIIQACEGNPTNFDLRKAKELKASNQTVDFLVLHLSELVRMTFIAATADNDQLRQYGLQAIQDVITKFAKVPEPEFPGHFIMEQYQAQVGAALRPAFTPDTPSDVTAMACEVCSTWIASGVFVDLNDLKRIQQLMVSSLAKLKRGKDAPSQLYSESASSMEKLAVLKAWAEVYVVAMTKQPQSKTPEEEPENDEGEPESLLTMVQPELPSLSKHWLAALKDYALLALPPEFSSQLPTEGGAFYSAEAVDSARPHYRRAWPPILYAAALWLNDGGFAHVAAEKNEDLGPLGAGMGGFDGSMLQKKKTPEEINSDRFHLILGISIEALCSPHASQPLETVSTCLHAMHKLLDAPWPRSQLVTDRAISIEVLNVLHRLLLTRDALPIQLAIMSVARQVILAAKEQLKDNKKQLDSKEEKADKLDAKATPVGEGGDSGDIVPGKSSVFAALEVCLCVLIRQIPALNPSMPAPAQLQNGGQRRGLGEEANQLVSAAVAIMADLPELCSPKGSVSVLPTILFLTTGVLRETSCQAGDARLPLPVSTALQSLKSLASSPLARDDACATEWTRLLQSTLATILDFSSKQDGSGSGVQQVTTLLALAMLIMASPQQVTTAPNLQEQCIDVFKKAWLSDNPQLQLKCLQTLSSIFQADVVVATPYIHTMGPLVVERLQQASRNKPSTEMELATVLEALKLLETLVAMTEDHLRVHLVNLLVPILVSYLVDSSLLQSTGKLSRTLHEKALQNLLKIGPQYPAAFKSVITSAPDLKAKLEAAIRASQASKAASTKQSKAAQPAQPSIKLKMNFSNFTG